MDTADYFEKNEDKLIASLLPTYYELIDSSKELLNRFDKSETDLDLFYLWWKVSLDTFCKNADFFVELQKSDNRSLIIGVFRTCFVLLVKMDWLTRQKESDRSVVVLKELLMDAWQWWNSASNDVSKNNASDLYFQILQENQELVSSDYSKLLILDNSTKKLIGKPWLKMHEMLKDSQVFDSQVMNRIWQSVSNSLHGTLFSQYVRNSGGGIYLVHFRQLLQCIRKVNTLTEDHLESL